MRTHLPISSYTRQLAQIACCVVALYSCLTVTRANAAVLDDATQELKLGWSPAAEKAYEDVVKRYVDATGMAADPVRMKYFSQSLKSYLSRLKNDAPRFYDQRDTAYIDAFYNVKLYDMKRDLDRFGTTGIPTEEEQKLQKERVAAVIKKYEDSLKKYFPSFTPEFIDATVAQVEEYYQGRVNDGFGGHWVKPFDPRPDY